MFRKFSKGSPDSTNADLAIDLTPIPPPYLTPATPNLSNFSLPTIWSLSPKEAKKCIEIYEDDASVVTQRHRTCGIPILASEIVIYIFVKDFSPKLPMDGLHAMRASRAIILTRGSIQLKKMPLKTSMKMTDVLSSVKAMTIGNVQDSSNPNIKFGIYELRGVHIERDLIMLAYCQDNEEKYAIYQTPESNRFLSPLTSAMAAAYVGVPSWAIPVAWSGTLDILQELDRVSKQDYIRWLGMDGGFSSMMYASALSYLVEHKLEIGKLEPGERAVEEIVQFHQPKRKIATPGAKVLDVVVVTSALTVSREQEQHLAYLVEQALHAVAFNLVFRKLRLAHYQPPSNSESFQNALAKALLYNVTLREVDFSSTPLTGICEEMGKAWAMNAQPLISKVNFSNCQLEGKDLAGLLLGLARIWCGGTALMEYINFNSNPDIPTSEWDTFFETFSDPTVFPHWPVEPPPPPSCAFLQELDLIKTNAVGPGLISFCYGLSGLKTLKISSGGFSGRAGANDDAAPVLHALNAAEAPLEVFLGRNMLYSGGGESLSSFSSTLKKVGFDGFSGDTTPVLCGWPVPCPNLTVTFRGSLSQATVSRASGVGFAPGSLVIENSDGFGLRAIKDAISIDASGLKKLYLSKMHYTHLAKAAIVLATGGLEYLRVDLEGAKDVGSPNRDSDAEDFWRNLATSTTLRDLRLPNQISSPKELTLVGQFLKTNRSVFHISFDSAFILDMDSVKALRSAFYGNKKVTELEYPTKAHKETMKMIERKTSEQNSEVHSCKAAIRRLFRSHYSKYNRNWRNEPNRLKLPYVERIRVAKRKIGALHRESAKIGQLLGEIRDCVDINRMERAEIDKKKGQEKLQRRESQLMNLGQKKKKYLTKLVTKLHSAKIRGRQNKAAKEQVPRSTYYQSKHMWPYDRRRPKKTPRKKNQRRHEHSKYRRYNDPHSTRYHNDDYGHYAHHSGHHQHYHGSDAGPVEEDDDNNAGLALLAWETIFSDVIDVLTPDPQDVWEGVNLLTQSGIENLEAIISPEFLSELHHEISELGADVVAEMQGILDEGAAIFDKVNEISESINVPAEVVERQLDSTVSENLDQAALESTLNDMPDVDAGQGDGTVDDVDDDVDYDDADDAVGMYAGAGPRDLDDGGPSFGGCGNAALSGARRRARTREENRKLSRVRRRTSHKLTGYRNLVLNHGIDERVEEEVDYTWPDNLKLLWAAEARDKQIEAMAKSELLQLPAVADEQPKLLSEWSNGVHCVRDLELELEVVLVTQCSLDRLANLEAQLARWAGKASVAVYVKPSECPVEAEEAISKTIDDAKGQVEGNVTGTIGLEVAVSIVEGCVDDEPYPINYLRNVALLEARRQHLRFHESLDKSAVLLVDVDFRPSANLNEILHTEGAAKMILGSRRVIVCPAFECSKPVCPLSISELRECSDNGEADGFHISHFPEGHGPTQFDKFWTESMECAEGVENLWKKCYEVEYERLFEPYIVMASRDVPLYDERFQGYGLNKVSHLASVAKLTKKRFSVLPGVFLVAPVHSRSESWAKRYGSQSDETRFNQLLLKGLYHNFMTGLAMGREAIVSDQTKAKQCFLGLQEMELQRRREKTASTANPTQLVRHKLFSPVSTTASRD